MTSVKAAEDAHKLSLQEKPCALQKQEEEALVSWWEGVTWLWEEACQSVHIGGPEGKYVFGAWVYLLPWERVGVSNMSGNL